MKKLCVTLMLVSSVLMAYAQGSETICNDGIDNDGDGFIDCFDGDCAQDNACEGSYIGNNSSCQAEPSQFPTFSLKLDFATPNRTANHIGRMAIGDLDRDGIPEMVTQNKYTDEVFVLNGATGEIKHRTTVDGDGRPEWRMAIANVEDDDCGEIFIVEDAPNNNWRVRAYNCRLEHLWSTPLLDDDPIHVGLADFNRDGNVEIYYKNEILNALTGEVLVNGNSGDFDGINGGPVAVDILGDEDLELVSGGTIYGVNLGAGTLTVLQEMPVAGGYHLKSGQWGKNATTSVADYDQDGYLDVITTGADNNDITTVFFWNVRTGVVKTFQDPIPTVEASTLKCNNAPPKTAYAKGWRNGTGRLNIGDLDGDGQLNVSFVSGRFLYALDENFEQLWRADVNEETSGWTGCTLFDFNGDGKTEVVYRDEQYLYILNGEDGSVFTFKPCISRTSVDYPIVADVDADGSTEICVLCGTDDQEAFDKFCNLSSSIDSQVRVYESNGEPWVPARRLWNQHGYFNVNVNDDLTIPQNQQKHHLVWSQGNCTVGPNRPLNGFLNQSPFLDSDGCAVFASPDLQFVENSLTVTPPNCPERDFTTSFQIENLGDAELSGYVHISFYDGDPFQTGATYLSTDSIDLRNFGPGDVFDVGDITVTGPGSPFNLYIVLNDNGSTLPTPVTLPNTNFLECDYTDNVIRVFVNPIPFPLSTRMTDDVRCDLSVPANGTASAFRQEGTTENTIDYNFNWFDSTVVSGAADHVGAIYTGLEASTYSVFATHKTAFCNSDTVQVPINSLLRTITVAIDSVGATTCSNPNGSVTAIVNGGEPTSNFTYEWYRSNQVFDPNFLLGTSHELSNLAPNVYVVIVTEKLTGCTGQARAEVADEAVPPVVLASHTDIDCSGADIGTVSAEVAGEGTTGFTFNWYRGNDIKPTPDFTGVSQGNLPAGPYTVEAIRNSTGCKSDTVRVTIRQTLPPVIDDATGTVMNSCDPSIPNGTATVSFSGLTNFSIEWYNGIGANPGNRRVANDDQTTITGLRQGTYTVKLIDDNTQCFVTDTVRVITRIEIPELTTSKVDATTCAPFNGSITATPSVDDPSDYTFFWYDGQVVKTTPDYATTGNVLQGLAPNAHYTVTAVNNTRNCDVLAPQTVFIADNTPAINITQTQTGVVTPGDCTSSTGELTISVTRSGNTQGFLIEWYAGIGPFTGAPIFSESGVTETTLPNIPNGAYTIFATDLGNGCQVSQLFELDYNQLQEVFVTKTDADRCTPLNGQLRIELDSKGLDEADFVLEVYQTDQFNTGSPLFTIPGSTGQTIYPDPSTPLDTLRAIEYTVMALNTSIAGCRSLPRTVKIDQAAPDPVIAFSGTTDNTICPGPVVAFNGAANIEIDGGASPANYNIQWFAGTDPITDPLITTTTNNDLTAEQIQAGVISVVVTNINTNCISSAPIAIQDQAPLPTIFAPPGQVMTCDLNTRDQDPIVINAQARENGIDVATYTYEWLDEDGNTIGNSANSPNILDGTYFVRAENAANNCVATTDVIVEDLTLNSVGISLLSFTNPSECFQPITNNNVGMLEVAGTGTGSSYSYEWYNADTISGPVANGIALHNNLIEGPYTVRVINDDNNCVADETYRLALIREPLFATASASPVTNCVTPDGSVFASMIANTGGSGYSYTWTLPDGTNRTGRELIGLSENDLGLYQVQVVDTANAACAATASATLNVDQLFPNLMLEAVAPLTTCDPARADGVARASVNGEIVGYTFDWFLGTEQVYSGAEYSGLLAQTYTVVSTNIINGCTDTEQVTIEENILPIPDPTLELISHVTSCEYDNGALSVSVNGNTSDYIFDWFNGQQTTGAPAFTGEIYDSLSAGFYTVIATSRITGCVSAPVTEEILEDQSFPEFEFVIKNASCGQEDGFAQLFVTNDVLIDSVVWESQTTGRIELGPTLTNASAGDYIVTVWSNEGCTVSEPFRILPEINPYNGVSRNGDGLNDIFMIECIEDFPNNLVKIFNRAGTLVYEAEGYDNSSIVFDGVSNKGMRVIGSNLPDGTYYYVIDKRDGSEPSAGYLEVLK